MEWTVVLLCFCFDASTNERGIDQILSCRAEALSYLMSLATSTDGMDVDIIVLNCI